MSLFKTTTAAAFILFALAAVVVLISANPTDYIENIKETSEIQRTRLKRDESSSGGGGWKLPGSGYLKKLRKLGTEYSALPNNLKLAIADGDFSKVTEDDIKGVNVSVLEYIPNKVFEKVDKNILSTFIDKFLQGNCPSALSRLIGSAGSKLDTNYLLDKLKNGGQTNVAGDVLLHAAVDKLGDKGITKDIATRLINENLLELVPEEQLMKVSDSTAAKTLLSAISHSSSDKDTDDKSLIIKLAETSFGPASTWTNEALKYSPVMPAAFLKYLKPELVTEQVTQLADTATTPLQAKAIADVYLENNKIEKNEDGTANPSFLNTLTSKLGKLSAFLPTSLTNNPNILKTIADGCEKLKLPAPIQSITKFFEEKLGGGRKISDLNLLDIQSLPTSILKNSPPDVLEVGMNEKAISENVLGEIGDSAKISEHGTTQNSFFQGLISQLASYAVQAFGGSSGRIDFSKLPAAFFGAIGFKGMDKIRGNDIDIAANGLKDKPDALDDIQKAIIMKKIKDNSGNDVDVPPELINLKPRKKGEPIEPDILEGLPSDSELRFAFGNGKKLQELEQFPHLIGNLSPRHVENCPIEDIPGLLALVRKSSDGPQRQTLTALHKRFIEYIRLKTDDDESEDKKLLKHLTPAEISKLPATVLAYFIDHRQTSKLPPDVRKEIMIAMGELSTKDHALIPGKTREEIILQGIDALDESLSKKEQYGVAEIAAMANAVVDLSPKHISRLSPIAVEQGLQIIQGTADDDDDGLKQRACLNPEQRKAWRDQIILNYGEPDTWSPSTVSTLCCSLELLNEDDLSKIDKYGITTCNCVSDLSPPSHLKELKKSIENNCIYELGKDDAQIGKKTFDRIKSEKSLDIEDLESQILSQTGRRRRKRDVGTDSQSTTLNCYALRLTGSTVGFDSKTLETLDPMEMKNCLYELGVEKLSHENSKILWKKLGECYGSIEKIPSESLRLAHHILNGISESDVSKLNFTDSDVVASFGRPLGLSKNVLRKLATHLEENIKYPLSRYTTFDLMTAGNILCGFEKDQLVTINPIRFMESLPILRSIEPSCEQTRLAALVNLAADPKVFGEFSTWDSADVRGVGTLLKGLTTEVKSIPNEAFVGVTSTVAGSLTDTLKELSPEQLNYFPSFSAQSMTEEQLNLLSDEGRHSLEFIQRGPIVVTDDSTYIKCSWTILLFVFVAQNIL